MAESPSLTVTTQQPSAQMGSTKGERLGGLAPLEAPGTVPDLPVLAPSFHHHPNGRQALRGTGHGAPRRRAPAYAHPPREETVEARLPGQAR